MQTPNGETDHSSSTQAAETDIKHEESEGLVLGVSQNGDDLIDFDRLYQKAVGEFYASDPERDRLRYLSLEVVSQDKVVICENRNFIQNLERAEKGRILLRHHTHGGGCCSSQEIVIPPRLKDLELDLPLPVGGGKSRQVIKLWVLDRLINHFFPQDPVKGSVTLKVQGNGLSVRRLHI